MVANGKVAASDLESIEGMRLETRTAAAYLAMKADASDAGIGLWLAQPAGGYRDLATQRDMHAHPARYGISLGVTIADVGKSTHGFGTALDIGSFPRSSYPAQFGDAGRKRRTWVLANASQFGFHRSFGESDHNHFQHNGTATAGGPGTPIKSEEFTMSSSVPIKVVSGNATTYYRIVDGLVESTIEVSTASRWMREIGYEGDVISANATKYLEEWRAREARYRALLATPAVPLSAAQLTALATQVAAFIPKPPTAAEIATATLNLEAKRLAD